MSIENIIERSYDIIGNYFIEEQKKRDDENRNKLLSDLKKNIKNGLVKELNGEELFTKDYKRDYFNKIKEMFIYLHGKKHQWKNSRYLLKRDNKQSRVKYGGNLMVTYDNPEQLFDSYFSEILKKIDNDEYIIGLYGMMDDYIIVFTNKLNIITYYNEKGPERGQAPYWNAHSGKIEGVKLGLYKETNNLLLNDLQIDLFHNLFNRLYFLNGIIISTKISKDIYTPSESYKVPIKEYLMYCNQNLSQRGNFLPDYYLYHKEVVEHIVFMFKTYWTGKFISPYAKKIELENIRLNEIHNQIYQEKIYLKQKEELDDKINHYNDTIILLDEKIIKDKEVTEKNIKVTEKINNLEMLQIVLKEKGKKVREIQKKNKEMLQEVKRTEINLKVEQSKLDVRRNEIIKDRENLNKEKAHFEKYKQFLLEQDI